MWINSIQCIDAGCISRKRYDHFTSPNFLELGLELNVQFGTGELYGEINTDHIYIGGVCVKNQDFAEIKQERGDVFIDVKLY